MLPSAVLEADSENVSPIAWAEGTIDECVDIPRQATIVKPNNFPIGHLAQQNEKPTLRNSSRNETSISPIQRE